MLVISLIAISPVIYFNLRGGTNYLLFSLSDFEGLFSTAVFFLSAVFGFGTVLALAQMQAHLMLHMGEGKTITFSRKEKLRRMAMLWLMVGAAGAIGLLFGLWYNHYI